jgi:hypothetical protein
MQKSTLNPSLKHHTIIGLLLGLWILIFILVVRPFGHGIMDSQKWLFVALGFSIIPFLSYLITSFLQRFIYQKQSQWNPFLEFGMYFLFFTLQTLGTYIYYLNPPVYGFYSFGDFFINIAFKTTLLLTPVIFFARRYSIKLLPKQEEEITLTGENKLDILKIKKSELICISNAQNYVEIFYLEGDLLKTKLIRTSLKKLQHEFDFLVQIHRSHLINLDHFKSWKDSATVELTQMELPVSKSYKNRLPSV